MIVLWVLDRVSRSGDDSADGEPTRPRPSTALSRAMWTEFPELHDCRHPRSIKAKMAGIIPTMMDQHFRLPDCTIPDIDARIDRVMAEVAKEAEVKGTSEGPSAGDGGSGTPPHVDSGNEEMVSALVTTRPD